MISESVGSNVGKNQLHTSLRSSPNLPNNDCPIMTSARDPPNNNQTRASFFRHSRVETILLMTEAHSIFQIA